MSTSDYPSGYDPPRAGGDSPREVDERLEDEIRARLASHDHEMSAVDVHVAGALVTLIGTVPTHVAKDEAERVVERVRGVDEVVNRIRVRHPA
jgi:osmotically-inducible protein OsmY